MVRNLARFTLHCPEVAWYDRGTNEDEGKYEAKAVNQNAIDLTEARVEDALDGSFLAEYRHRMDFFFAQLVRLNANLYLVERIIRFPFELFAPLPDDAPFFTIVSKNLLDMTVIVICRLLTDDDPHSYTLLRFHKAVMKAVKPPYKALLIQEFAQLDFKQIRNQANKVRIMRNKRVAHAERDFALPLNDKDKLAIVVLQKLRDGVNLLFDIMSFDHHYSKLNTVYDPNVHNTPEPDIDKLLNSLAKDSPLLNMPEQWPEYWPHHREDLSEKQLEVLNLYRQKFGLPTV